MSDLVKENMELRERCADLEKQLWDLCAKHGELLTQLEELRARPQNFGQTVNEYTKRDGTRWAKIRTGWNTYVHRQVA